tara:strand:- start:660 stop:893 length:234 start_codon:yes stop_codon:yes gene_type:complete
MINTLSTPAAVLTKRPVPSKNGFSMQGGTTPVRGRDLITQPDYRRSIHFDPLRTNRMLAFVQQLSLLAYQEQNRSSN